MIFRSIAYTFIAYAIAVMTAGEMTATEPVAVTDISDQIASGHTTRIVCFGDSITGAYYHTGGQRAWCDLLGFALQKTFPRAKLKMINAGISGNTTTDALARIERDVIDQNPHLVVISFGMNDVTRVPIDDFRRNLNSIVDRCQDNGTAVLLCTPNSVIENEARPNQRLSRYADAVIEVAEDNEVDVVDLFRLWQQWREDDPTEWLLAMSDDIHPNMNGHRQFAKWIATSISGRPVQLNDLQPPLDSMYHTLNRLRDGQRVKIVASSPYDAWTEKFLREWFPAAKIETIRWPTPDPNQIASALQQQTEWAQRIRSLEPDLVIPAVPFELLKIDSNRPDALRKVAGDFEWLLNYSFPFAGRNWDVLPVVPSSGAGSQSEVPSPSDLARQIIVGKDVLFVDFGIQAEPQSTEESRFLRWFDRRLRSWRGSDRELPETNDDAWIPAQAWPYRPGPREVRVTIYYPGGRLSNVNEETGIMLTLHNWGGTDCVGTASPDALANRLNVIAVCVNYLQSGKQTGGDEGPPYDFGYFQALDALRALAYVRDGLLKTNRAYDDHRVFCTGGSGGGNVTLMANKLAPRTFACVIDMCGMTKLSDDIAFGEPGGSKLRAFWSRDTTSANFLSADHQQIRFVGEPNHLDQMKKMESFAKIIVVHGVDDMSCPFSDAEQLVSNLRAAKLDVEPHFIDAKRVDGKIFTTTGHALGDRTEIVFAVAGHYLDPNSPAAVRRIGETDFQRKEDLVYPTVDGQFVISYADGIPVAQFITRNDVQRNAADLDQKNLESAQ